MLKAILKRVERLIVFSFSFINLNDIYTIAVFIFQFATPYLIIAIQCLLERQGTSNIH